MTPGLKGTVGAYQFLLGSILQPVVHLHPDIERLNQRFADKIKPVCGLHNGLASGN
jgi:hypothetical protein